MNLETIFKAAMTDDWPGQEDRVMDAIEAAYSLGFHEGRILERSIALTFAFGAIRRAVEIARWHDTEAGVALGCCEGYADAIVRAVNGERNREHILHFVEQLARHNARREKALLLASKYRSLIRAAIGSDKA